jgi:hypothetical protein
MLDAGYDRVMTCHASRKRGPPLQIAPWRGLNDETPSAPWELTMDGVPNRPSANYFQTISQQDVGINPWLIRRRPFGENSKAMSGKV